MRFIDLEKFVLQIRPPTRPLLRLTFSSAFGKTLAAATHPERGWLWFAPPLSGNS
jgi:hypothetical protein